MDKNKRRISLSFKLNILIIAIILAVSIGLVFISYRTYSSKIDSLYYAKVETLAHSVSVNYTENLILPLIAMAQSEEFQEVREQAENTNDHELLEQWMMKHKVKEFYTSELEFAGVDAEEEANQPLYNLFVGGCGYLSYVEEANDVSAIFIQYDLDGVTYNLMDTSGNVLRIGTAEEPEEKFAQYADNGSVPATIVEMGGKWICTACEPIYNYEEKKPIALAGVDIDMDEVMREHTWFVWNCIVFVLIETVLAIVAAMIMFYRTVIRPIGMLSAAAQEFGSAEEDYTKEHVISLNIRSNDEISDLYGEIRSMETRIIDYADNIEKITAEKERTLTELRTAAQIQESMLPTAFPDREEFDLYASMSPAREVGGDFYDFFFRDEDHLVLVIADVSGKGIPAALFMTVSKLLIHERAMMGGTPAQILMAVNDRICEDNHYRMFVTVWLGILEISTGKMVCANAGHEYPVLKNPGGKFELLKNKHGLVLGAMEHMKYRDYELSLAKGSCLFVYTDGVPEATDAQQNMYGTARLVETLNRVPDESPAHILEHVKRSVDAFAKDEPQFDDLTMLCLRM